MYKLHVNKIIIALFYLFFTGTLNSKGTASVEDVVIEEFARQKLQGEQDDDEDKEEEDKS